MNDQLNQNVVRNCLPQLGLAASVLLGSNACSGDTVTIIEPGPSGQQTASAGSRGDGGAGSTGSSSTGDGGSAATGDAGSGGAAGSEAGSADEGPLYIVNTTISSPDGRLAYFIATSSIDENVQLDVRAGLEIPGNARAFPLPGVKNTFLASGGESPTFTRYEVVEGGKFVRGDGVSFANFGVENPNGPMYFVSATKAYYLDYSQTQIISFNPESMKVLRAITIDDGDCDAFVGPMIPRDGGFYFPQSCAWEKTPPTGGSLLFLNSDTDEITTSAYSGCTALEQGFVADNGDAYWFSDGNVGLEWTMFGLTGPHDCALRLPAGETSFDPNWELDVTSRTGGVAAMAIAPPGAGGSKFWMKVFDESKMAASPPVEEINWGEQAWVWGLLDLESNDPIEIDEDADPIVADNQMFSTDARYFATSANADYTETTLLELSESGVITRLHVLGEIRKVIRLR